jgi:hypothetical protein
MDPKFRESDRALATRAADYHSGHMPDNKYLEIYYKPGLFRWKSC